MASASIVIPSYNEGQAVGETVSRVFEAFRNSDHTIEVIVVDDGSGDDTAEAAARAKAQVLRHPCNIGYGNALLTGIHQAKYPLVVIADADGTYPIDEMPDMVAQTAEQGLDMLVGARQGSHYHGSAVKRLARICFKFLAEFACGRKIPDINSGLRVMRRDMVLQVGSVLCGGFSFTTTITIISLLTNRFVKFRPIAYERRIGKSHVRYFRDTLRTAQIILMTILIFNPIKLYLLYSGFVLAFGLLSALATTVLAGFGTGMLMATMSFFVSSVLMAFGFLAEQRRSSPFGVVAFQKQAFPAETVAALTGLRRHPERVPGEGAPNPALGKTAALVAPDPVPQQHNKAA